MSLLKNQQMFAFNVSRLLAFIYSKGLRCTLGEVWRTPEQAELNAKRGIGIKNSLHCSRLAIDINLFSDHNEYLIDSEDYRVIGQYWESLHRLNKWGGLKDGNHFEMRED